MAVANGADRIELCAGLSVGGLTPSPGMIEQIRSLAPELPIMAMVRSREGGFCYSEDEFTAMKRDAAHLVKWGVEGIVFGFLFPDGRMDLDRMKMLVEIADGRQTMMHRASDSTPDLVETVEQLMALGVTRVLTSGGAGKAHLGATKLGELKTHGAGRIEILPGGGILPENVGELIKISGCDQIHFAARKEGLTSYGGVADMVPAPEILTGIRASLAQAGE